MGHATRTKSKQDLLDQADQNKGWMADYVDKLSVQVERQQAVDNCKDCQENPEWERRTQFAGNHPFCDVHARLEPGFGDDSSSYFFWTKYTV